MKGNGGVYESWEEGQFWFVCAVCSVGCPIDSFFLSDFVDVLQFLQKYK